MSDSITCLHDKPREEWDPPDVEFVRIQTRPTVQTWLPGGPVIPGHVWCWAHRRWEDIPVDNMC